GRLHRLRLARHGVDGGDGGDQDRDRRPLQAYRPVQRGPLGVRKLAVALHGAAVPASGPAHDASPVFARKLSSATRRPFSPRGVAITRSLLSPSGVVCCALERLRATSFSHGGSEVRPPTSTSRSPRSIERTSSLSTPGVHSTRASSSSAKSVTRSTSRPATRPSSSTSVHGGFSVTPTRDGPPAVRARRPSVSRGVRPTPAAGA